MKVESVRTFPVMFVKLTTFPWPPTLNNENSVEF